MDPSPRNPFLLPQRSRLVLRRDFPGLPHGEAAVLWRALPHAHRGVAGRAQLPSPPRVPTSARDAGPCCCRGRGKDGLAPEGMAGQLWLGGLWQHKPGGLCPRVKSQTLCWPAASNPPVHTKCTGITHLYAPISIYMHAKTGYKTQEKYDDIGNKNYRLQNG